MQAEAESAFQIISLGVTDYLRGMELQLKCHAMVRDFGHEGALIFLEHNPILTLGKNASLQYLLRHEDSLKELGVDLVRTDRGGEITAHMPGQLVVYPVLPLRRMKLSPKLYVDRLIETIQLTLRDFGVEGYQDEKYPGLWVQGKKICAIGIRIKERVSLHGLALNVDNNLDLFDEIIPCGIEGRKACSLKSLLHDNVTLPTRECIEKTFSRHFSEVFGVPLPPKSW